MSMRLEELEQIGLTKGETKVYQALLDLGESTKTPIAKKSGVSPGRVYDVLERLIRKGLASSIKKGNVMHFRVANPKKLKSYLDAKKKEILREEEIVEKLLPSLLAKYSDSETESDAEVYKGWKGLETVYDDLIDSLNKGDTDLVLGATRGADPERTKLFFTRFNKKRYNKGIKLKIIYSEKDRNFAPKYITNKKLDKIKYIQLQTPAEINVYDNKVIILILTNLPIAIVIRSKEAADSFRQYFEAMWKIAKP
jgi:HTH-type transcriptional regulator, sugar sensing transcriptional regulator